MLGEINFIQIVTDRRRAEYRSVAAGMTVDRQAAGDRVFLAVLITVFFMSFDRACYTGSSADINTIL